MDKTYSLSNRGALIIKIWPMLITLCVLFLIFAYKATQFSLIFALIVTGSVWWRSSYVPHLIMIKSDGRMIFKSFLKKVEIGADDIHSIVENTYYKEIAVLHQGGRIAIPATMSNINDFIETVKQLNPSIELKLHEQNHDSK